MQSHKGHVYRAFSSFYVLAMCVCVCLLRSYYSIALDSCSFMFMIQFGERFKGFQSIQLRRSLALSTLHIFMNTENRPLPLSNYSAFRKKYRKVCINKHSRSTFNRYQIYVLRKLKQYVIIIVCVQLGSIFNAVIPKQSITLSTVIYNIQYCFLGSLPNRNAFGFV